LILRIWLPCYCWRESNKTVTVESSITIVGIKEALRELQKVEPDLAKEIKKEYKTIVKVLVDDIKSTIQDRPLSGFARAWEYKGRKIGPWDQSAVIKSIIPRFSNRKRGNSLAVFSVTMKSPFGAVADMAGRKNDPETAWGAVMIRALSSKFGKPSRGMWPAYERNASEINKNLEVVVDKLTDAANRRLLK
jgi:hypothetical protein